MAPYAMDTVSYEEKRDMERLLQDAGHGITVDEIVESEDNPFDNKEEVVSVLHALLNEGEVSHNINREYYLTA